MKSQEKITRLVALPDLHLQTRPVSRDSWEPDISQSVYTALSFLMDFRPHVSIILGDLMNFDLLSSHKDDQSLLHRELRRLEHDITLANGFLDLIDKYTLGEKIFLLGNHDSRLYEYVAMNPHLEGIVSWDALEFSKRKKWKIVPEGKAWKYGHANFVHGWYWNMYHAKKTVSEVGGNIFYGHVHDIQVFSKPNINQEPILGASLGCLCSLNPAWQTGKPNRWVNAFGVFYFRENGNFSFYIPTIIGGETVWAGKLYGPEPGRKELFGAISGKRNFHV